jgi:hypothetical protein
MGGHVRKAECQGSDEHGGEGSGACRQRSAGARWVMAHS